MRKTGMRCTGRVLAAMLVGVVLLAACSSDDGNDSSSDSGGDSKDSLIVGSKDFAGAQIVSQAYGQALESKGYEVTYKENIGPTETVYPLLENGDIDLYGEFQGTFLTYLEGVPTADSAETFAAVEEALADKDVVAVGPASVVDVNVFVVTKETAELFDLETVSDLTAIAPDLVFGGPSECLDRPLCLGETSQQLYGLDFKEVKKLDAGGPLTSQALDDSTIDVGLLFTGSSLIKPNYVKLRDDKGLQPADNPIAVVRKDKDSEELNSILESVNAELDLAAYNEMSLRVINDKEDPAAVVTDWLESVNLI